MSEVTPVLTWTPILQAGTGPTCENPNDAINEIIADVYERVHEPSWYGHDTESIVNTLAEFVSDWEPGVWTIFGKYQLVIKFYTRQELDEMPEFQGY